MPASSIRERAAEIQKQVEILVRDADDRLAGGYDLTPLERQTERRRRNAINAAANALFRAVRA